ncbi:hypothetical protein U8527_18660 [Kordia algicida OT-1]|uniref:Lipoprotein n=1 Tax=Kordia algicida OT-1 TaxID=391587 RepID=A9DJ36_9FLAO|nr:hypothetical protein [Kordia algicida]EDP98021.1 hypothetical protein KAOT1_12427 [Kordia algicida OT-1]
MDQFLKIAFFFLVVVFGCNAQHKKPADFIPEGYVKFEEYFGDLNKDKQEDCVLIIKKVDKKNIVFNRFDKEVDRNRRGIIILFKHKNGYQLADKNYNCFSSENEDGGVYFPPQLSIEFKRGNLIVHYGHGRYGFWSYTFRFQEANFKLIGYDESSNRGPVTLSEISINFLTKKKLIRENTNQDAEGGDEVFKETWKDVKIEKLIKLSEIKDFDELEMYKY